MQESLICKCCGIQNFDMVMIKDDLWLSISENCKDLLCVNCMESKLGRRITERDFKSPGIPCNEFWLWKNNKKF